MSFANEFTFAGQQTDPSGLQYLRARFYDPAAGRFLSSDSFGGLAGRTRSLNRYVYAENNPVGFADPSGRALPCDPGDCGDCLSPITVGCLPNGTIIGPPPSPNPFTNPFSGWSPGTVKGGAEVIGGGCGIAAVTIAGAQVPAGVCASVAGSIVGLIDIFGP